MPGAAAGNVRGMLSVPDADERHLAPMATNLAVAVMTATVLLLIVLAIGGFAIRWALLVGT